MGSNTSIGRRNIGAVTSNQNVPAGVASIVLSRTLLVKKLNTGRCTTSQELADRFTALFELAQQNGFVPTVEMLGLCSRLGS